MEHTFLVRFPSVSQQTCSKSKILHALTIILVPRTPVSMPLMNDNQSLFKCFFFFIIISVGRGALIIYNIFAY